MPSKNDLSSLKVKSKNSLIQAQNDTSAKITVTAWRKPKSIQEKQSRLVGLRFTISELEWIKKKAGLVPIATYLKKELIDHTTVLN